jgi:hypothetical protein
MKRIKERVWTDNNARYSQGSVLKIGTVIVAETHRAIGNKSEPDAPLWVATCKLPGIRLKLVNGETPRFLTEAEAKSACESMVLQWFGFVTE